MNSNQFAHIWLETHGLFDKDSDYDGWLGKSVEETWAFIASQGHSGGSAARTFQLLQAIYEAYDNPDDPIWKAYWESDEGRKIKESFEGGRPLPAHPIQVKTAMLVMPNPTPEQLNDPLFEAIWQVIKSWDINVPGYYEGYCGATGSHVMLIFNELKKPE